MWLTLIPSPSKASKSVNNVLITLAVVINHQWHIQDILFLSQNRIIVALGTSCIHSWPSAVSHLSEVPDCFLQVQSPTRAYLHLAGACQRLQARMGAHTVFAPTQSRGWETQGGNLLPFLAEPVLRCISGWFPEDGWDRASVAVVEVPGEHILILAFPPSLLYAPCTIPRPAPLWNKPHRLKPRSQALLRGETQAAQQGLLYVFLQEYISFSPQSQTRYNPGRESLSQYIAW